MCLFVRDALRKHEELAGDQDVPDQQTYDRNEREEDTYRWHKGMREIHQSGDVEHDFLVFPFKGERVKAAIGAETSIIHQQIQRNTQSLRPPVDLLRSAFAAQVSGDNIGADAVLFRECLRQRAQFVCFMTQCRPFQYEVYCTDITRTSQTWTLCSQSYHK